MSYEPDDYEPDYDDFDATDYDDNGYSATQQMWADRMDYAQEMYEKGLIDETQRAEIRMGA
jgi:hypothetical protein